MLSLGFGLMSGMSRMILTNTTTTLMIIPGMSIMITTRIPNMITSRTITRMVLPNTPTLDQSQIMRTLIRTRVRSCTATRNIRLNITTIMQGTNLYITRRQVRSTSSMIMPTTHMITIHAHLINTLKPITHTAIQSTNTHPAQSFSVSYMSLPSPEPTSKTYANESTLSCVSAVWTCWSTSREKARADVGVVESLDRVIIARGVQSLWSYTGNELLQDRYSHDETSLNQTD